MKFLIDMNLSPLWVPFLREKGLGAVHWSTIGKPWAADTSKRFIQTSARPILNGM
jgi:predicted nuclease of predicted toxin-antitoxin system